MSQETSYLQSVPGANNNNFYGDGIKIEIERDKILFFRSGKLSYLIEWFN